MRPDGACALASDPVQLLYLNSLQVERSQVPQANARPSRAKQEQILAVATELFGRRGYEETRWAEVAAAVHIGSTALYHYFQSKQHCLFEVMAAALADSRARFDRITGAHDDWQEGLLAVLVDGFDLDDHAVLQRRVLAAEQGRLAVRGVLSGEEVARGLVRQRRRDLEFAWGTFLARGMQLGLVAESDPQLLARAVLGLYDSVWSWFRPGGALELAVVGRFYTGRQLALLGLDVELAADRFAVAA
jgi:AcrR family transcriptional regulator